MRIAKKTLLVTLLTASALTATPAFAETSDAEMDALRAEVAALKAQLAAISAKLDAVAAEPAKASVADKIATTEKISIEKCTLFYYEVYEYEYDEDEKTWSVFSPEMSFTTQINLPTTKELCGYDVVNFYAKSSPECSLLSCNGIADDVEVNSHCLFKTFEEAKHHLEAETFKDCEPGPYRIFAVYKIG